MPLPFDYESPRPPKSPMGTVVALCLIIGSVGYTLVSIMGGPREAGFWLFAGAGGLLVYVLTFIDMRIGIGIMILAVGISPEMEVEGVPNIRIEDFIVPVLAFGWISRHIAGREPFRVSLLKGPIMAYLAAAVFAALIGMLQETVPMRQTTLVLGKTVVYFLIYLIMLNTTRTVEELKAYTILLILVAVLTSLTTVGEAQVMGADSTSRLHGPSGETANIFAGYLIMTLAMIVGLFLHATTFPARFGLGVAGVMVFYPVMVTLSRTSYISLAVAITTFALLRERRLLILTLFLFIVVPLLAPEHVLGRISSIYTSLSMQQDESFAARVREWGDAWGKMVHRPLGWGPGSIPLGHVDNEYLRVGVDMGFLGLAVFLWMLARTWKMAFNNYDAPLRDPTVKGIAAGFCISFLAVIIHAIGTTSFSSIRTMETFMILAGLASALYAAREEWGLVEKAPEPEDPYLFGIRQRRMGPRPV